MKRETLLLCVGVLVNSAAYEIARAAVPLEPTFTIQGQLPDSVTAPLPSSVMMKFILFDVATGGVQVPNGATTLSSVPLDHGLFTATVDFGSAEVFNGDARWVEVWTNRSGTLLPEDPRIPILATPYALQTRGLFVDDQRKVGIGTTAPLAKLEVVGDWNGIEGALRIRGDKPTIGFTGGPLTNNTSWVMHVGSIPAGALTFARNLTPNTFSYLLNLTADDRVGIGTASPTTTLHVAGTGIKLGNAAGTKAIELSTSGSDVDLGASATDLFIQSNGPPGNNSVILQSNAGNVGIGTGAGQPAAKLHVVGNRMRLQNGAKVFDLRADGGSVDLESTTDNLFIHSSGLNGKNNIIMNPFGNEGNVGIGTGNPAAKLDVNGTARVKILEIMGADLAEKFPVSEKVEPGFVVEIDPDHPGQLRLSRGVYNRRVAGVVSGANGLSVGAVLGNLPGQEDAPPIALSGRVWVNCDASNGVIEPGDLLTTSSVPGVAMKADDYVRSQGAAIGKAMTTLKSGDKGMVLVLVNLQ